MKISKENLLTFLGLMGSAAVTAFLTMRDQRSTIRDVIEEYESEKQAQLENKEVEEEA